MMILGVVVAAVFIALLAVKIRQELGRARDERKAEQAEYDRCRALLEFQARIMAKRIVSEMLEASHPTDGLEYPLLPSREITVPIRHDAPYPITTVILPMEQDHSKWN
jgi:hypothetical protein